MAGRKMKLTTDKKDRADQRKRTEALQKHDEALADLDPSPPKGLMGYAKQAYSKIVNDLNGAGLIKNIDQNVVIELAKQIQVSRSAYIDIFGGDEPMGTLIPVTKSLQGPDGKVIDTVVTGWRQNPSVRTLDSATAKIKSYSEALGMTPTSRASLLNLISSDDDEESGDWRSQSMAPQFANRGGDVK